MTKPDHKHCDRTAQMLLQTFRWEHGIKNASCEKITDIPNIDRLAQVEKIHARHDGFDSRSDSPVLVTHRGEPMQCFKDNIGDADSATIHLALPTTA